MPYAIKEIYYTLQGEGAQAGRPAIFCRFTGCNLWSGREADRAEAICSFCDTDFLGTNGPRGGQYQSANEVTLTLLECCAANGIATPAGLLIVLTGGEPLLQVDRELINAMHRAGFEIALETNGTLPLPETVDWLCVSPKANTTLLLDQGDEFKLVFPQLGLDPAEFLPRTKFTHYYLQPMDGPAQVANTRAALDYCLAHPPWRLSLQQHKILGIP